MTAVHSVAGLLAPGAGLLVDRPFRAPHHTISNAALIGGGSQPRPGEVSLAHHGVLFLDEMLEFSRHVLEVLRQPLEEGRVTIARAARTAVFPARFMLVGAMNPCPCGFAGDTRRECRCTPQQLARYRDRLSGPLRDRLDLTVEVPALPLEALSGGGAGEPSAAVRGRVVAARARQVARQAGDGIATNAELTPGLMAKHCGYEPRGAACAPVGDRAHDAERARLRPRPEGGAHDCRSRRRGRDRRGCRGGGAAVPDAVTFRAGRRGRSSAGVPNAAAALGWRPSRSGRPKGRPPTAERISDARRMPGRLRL